MGATTAFRKTQIGRRLQQLADADEFTNELLAEVTRIVRKVTPILDRYASAAPTFTRHDASHALNVLTLMGNIIPEDTLNQLGALDLALLVLSAYLHDVGMSPPEDEIGRLGSLLDTGGTEEWDGHGPELAAFRDYLTVRWHVPDPPLRKSVAARELTNRRCSIITDWVRQNHAARSSQAIDHYATRDSDPWRLTYRSYDYRDLLKRVCASHDRPTGELSGHDFQIFGVGGAVMSVAPPGTWHSLCASPTFSTCRRTERQRPYSTTRTSPMSGPSRSGGSTRPSPDSRSLANARHWRPTRDGHSCMQHFCRPSPESKRRSAGAGA